MIAVRERHRWDLVRDSAEEQCSRCPARRRTTLVGVTRSYSFAAGVGLPFGPARPSCLRDAPLPMVRIVPRKTKALR